MPEPNCGVRKCQQRAKLHISLSGFSVAHTQRRNHNRRKRPITCVFSRHEQPKKLCKRHAVQVSGMGCSPLRTACFTQSITERTHLILQVRPHQGINPSSQGHGMQPARHVACSFLWSGAADFSLTNQISFCKRAAQIHYQIPGNIVVWYILIHEVMQDVISPLGPKVVTRPRLFVAVHSANDSCLSSPVGEAPVAAGSGLRNRCLRWLAPRQTLI